MSKLKNALILDTHSKLRKENRARAINKQLSEIMISDAERTIKRVQRKAKPKVYESYDLMRADINLTEDEKK